VHGNFVEDALPAVVLQLIGGLRFPIPAAGFGLAYNVGRLLFAVGYMWKGHPGSVLGTIVVYLSLVALTILAIWAPILILLQR
jgi:glutathione S-transferase